MISIISTIGNRFLPLRNHLLSIALFFAISFGIHSTIGAHEIAKELHDAAQTLLNTLDETQKSQLVLEFDSELRKDWQFIPMERKGLPLSDMKPNQRWLALSLVQTALSHRGFSQTMQIMSLEQVLHEMENQSPKRNPEKYHFFFFGQPSLEKTWGWRVEGHHLSISFTIVDGKTVVSTPAFFGANPGEVRQGPQKGLRVLGVEEDMGRQLIKSLTVEQKSVAIISEEAPGDVINGPGRVASPLEPVGIAAKDLTNSQRAVLTQLVELFVNKLRPGLAEKDMTNIEQAGFDKVHFAWAGQLLPGKPHYYRIQGPTFSMEYDNTQNDANHVHAVWRDFTNDFGEDLLKKHYETQPHENGQTQKAGNK